MATLIRNGKAYPLPFKNNVLDVVRGTTFSNKEVAERHNIHRSTVSRWKRGAGLQGPVPAGLQRYQANQAAIRSNNTPVVQPNGDILYRGRIYK